ncbi:uncharacterized protein LOC110621134 isoform X1 [Manihot esculenta]|uniref:Uncharacterized protein n=7 Tax=Manihot esculenta TaxID=3983 RepID=A0A2C9WJN8_MANES|nr:uncharacterized protein LOC110621134 isoform X1 [Manihot esculenta]XP_043811598.1 uncharacterized protein LOC110621134 isoform X1 [Manihot esculenta]OAY59805.1 hypothetical protein MANES_01G060875v8 [Manihot esculenta]
MVIIILLIFFDLCLLQSSPNTVLPCRHFSDAENKIMKSKLAHKDGLLTVKQGFTEISFRRYRSSSCKTPTRTVGLEGNVELKRGSVYQNSTEVRKMKNMGVNEGRRKIELSLDNESTFSFSIVDSLCCSDEENTQKRSPKLSVNSSLNPTSVRKSCIEPCSSEGFIEICPNLGKREKQSSGTVRCDSIENPTFRCEQVAGPVNDANDMLENDMALTFHKSLSAKLEMPHSPSPSESSCSSRASSKSRFSPIKKMFDPFMKSKSLRSSLSYIAEHGDVKTTGISNVRNNQITRKSLTHDFANTIGKSDIGSPLVRNGHNLSTVACSPVHLHGCLKLENKHGVPYFKFSLDCPEEVFVAKTRKENNAVNWVYTFHSICNRKKSNVSGWSLTDSNKESLMVGQMQVSCYLNSDLNDGGDVDNSMVMEFVLYDIAHARQSVCSQDSLDIVKSPNCSKAGYGGATHELDSGSDAMKFKHQTQRASYSNNSDSSSPYPTALLHSDLEIAAIVIQLPFAKRESMKCNRGNRSNVTMHSNLLNHSTVGQRRKDFTDRENPDKLNVVIPTGNHSLPIDESQGPSSLLDRWRIGGGCDCGGWDMSCPLTVFGSPGIRCAEDKPLMDYQKPLELFVQGTKQKIPALTMRAVEEGQYAVHFHAQLSTLQAFSICVAALHGIEASNAIGKERSKQLAHGSSLKALIEEEMQFLIETVTEEEKKKAASKKMEEIQQTYVLNPPFSPIARV